MSIFWVVVSASPSLFNAFHSVLRFFLRLRCGGDSNAGLRPHLGRALSPPSWASARCPLAFSVQPQGGRRRRGLEMRSRSS